MEKDPDLKSLHRDPRFEALVAHAKERASRSREEAVNQGRERRRSKGKPGRNVRSYLELGRSGLGGQGASADVQETLVLGTVLGGRFLAQRNHSFRSGQRVAECFVVLGRRRNSAFQVEHGSVDSGLRVHVEEGTGHVSDSLGLRSFVPGAVQEFEKGCLPPALHAVIICENNPNTGLRLPIMGSPAVRSPHSVPSTNCTY